MLTKNDGNVMNKTERRSVDLIFNKFSFLLNFISEFVLKKKNFK